MNIVIVGRGNVGGGLAALWRKAGHEVTALGRGGGDANGADVVVVAVPGSSISAALGGVTGLAVKSFTSGPVAKTFNLNFASLYDQIAVQRVRPSSFYAADAAARDITEELIIDVGYDPVPLGGLDKARGLEDLAWLLFAAMKDGAPVFYRFAVPGEL